MNQKTKKFARVLSVRRTAQENCVGLILQLETEAGIIDFEIDERSSALLCALGDLLSIENRSNPSASLEHSV